MADKSVFAMATDTDEPVPELTALAAWRPDPKNPKLRQWLICNGMHMGRWTSYFGVNCLADIYDCRLFVKNKKQDIPELVVVEYDITLVKGV